MRRPPKLPRRSARARAESKHLWNDGRSLEMADFYTFGYEGRSLDQLKEALILAGVRTVLDIRRNPMSMYRPELSKSNFRESIETTGMRYFHVREWGVPSEVRWEAANLRTRDVIWRWYDARIVEKFFDKNLHWFLNLEHPVAMMCMEHDPTECHRHRLFLALERKGLCGFDL